MTKADRIRETAKTHSDWSTTRIGAECDCSDAYVRVVLRQRLENGKSENDRRYLASDRGREVRRLIQAKYDLKRRPREASHA